MVEVDDDMEDDDDDDAEENEDFQFQSAYGDDYDSKCVHEDS